MAILGLNQVRHQSQKLHRKEVDQYLSNPKADWYMAFALICVHLQLAVYKIYSGNEQPYPRYIHCTG